MNKLESRRDFFYQRFIEQGGLKKIRHAKKTIIDMEIEDLKKYSRNKEEYEKQLAFIQKKISYLFNTRMYTEIVKKNYMNNTSMLTIPAKWNPYFKSQSIQINRYMSRIKWFTFILLLIMKSTIEGFANIIRKENYEINNFIAAQRLNNIKTVLLNPKFPMGDKFKGDPALDFGGWYAKSSQIDKRINIIHFEPPFKHTEVKYEDKAVFSKSFKSFNFGISFSSKITLTIFSIKLLCQGVAQTLSGNFATLVGYNELLFSKRISLVPLKELPDKVLFSDNHGILMPIWVNQLVKSQISVEYVFFSSYDSPSIYNDEDPRQDFWKLNSWPKMICVDEFQAEFFNKNSVYKNQIVEVGGFPYFTDKNYESPNANNFTISVFDFEPGKNTMGISTISECGYHNLTVNQKFISIIYDIAEELDLLILHKPKRRSVIENRSEEYKEYINRLDRRHYISVPPEVSPARLIKETNCTISMPITTPSILANKLGRKAIYFDPLGKVHRKDPALRGITIASNPIELRDLLGELKKDWDAN